LFAATSTTVCIAAAAATAGLFWLRLGEQQTSGALVFIAWTVSPYAALLVVTLRWLRSTTASIVVTLGAIAIAAFGLTLLYGAAWPYLEARWQGTRGPLNCGGPVIELGVPLVQWIAVVVLALLARVTSAVVGIFWPAERRARFKKRPA
jgi:hypothetical protein